VKRIVLYVLIVFQSFEIVQGQGMPTSVNHFLSYSLGINQAKEENLLLKVHSGAIHCFAYSVEIKNDAYQCIELQLGYSTLTTGVKNDAGSSNEQLSLGYSYNVKLHEQSPLTYYVGAKCAYTSSLSEYQTWDEAHAYWGSCISFAASNVLFVDLQSERSFVVHLDLSLFGLTARPEQYRLYSNEYWTFSNIISITNSGYRFGTWNNLFQLRTSAEYRTPIFGSSAVSLSGSLYYSRLKAGAGNPLKEIISKISLGIWL
jgi:hypothetical protein